MSANYVGFVASLIDPAKLDILTGKRAATPRLQKVCYWLETARKAGHDPGAIIEEEHEANGVEDTIREQVQREALLRNLTILDVWGASTRRA